MRLSTVLRMGACALAMSGVALADAPNEAAEVKVAQAATPPAPASDARSDRVEKVVVTAQKRAQALRDVPLPVQAIQGSQLEQTGSNEISDLVTQIPGASAVSRTSPGFETISIRGISSGTTGDATTGYYIDDVAFGVPNLQLVPPARLFDLQRVEVLRGPQGTLWGQGAMGGTIRLITPRADSREFAARGQVEGSLTQDGAPSYAVDGVLNVPIAKGVAGLRLNGGYESVGGFAESPDFPGREDINGVDSWNFRAKLGLELSDNVDVEFTYWRIDNKQDFLNTMQSVDPPLITGTGGNPIYIDTSLSMYSAVLSADLGGATLTSSTAFYDHELDFDATFLAVLRNDSNFATTSFTQELRLASDDDGPFNWIIGGYYADGQIESDICLSLVLPCTTTFSININSFGTIETQAWALFGEASYTFGQVTALVGARYFEDDRGTNGLNRNTLVRTTNGSVFETFNPRFNLSWKPNEDTLFYFNAAKGFRSGAFQTPAQAAAAGSIGVATGVAIAPDSVWSYEVGGRGDLFGGALQYDVALYHLDWTDIQMQFTVFGVAALANGGDAHSRGIDLGLYWNTPIEGLQLQLIGNTNEAEFDTVAPAIAAISAFKPGARIPNVPESNVTLGALYSWDVSAWNAEAFIHGGYIYRAEQLDSTGRISDSLEEYNLRVGLDTERWRLTLFGDNLTDNRVALTNGSLGFQPNRPRMIGARFAYNF